MRKNFALLVAAVVVIALGYVYLAYGTAGTKHDTPNEPIERVQMHIVLEGEGISAKISMYSIDENDKKEGFVELPFSKYYLSKSTKITALSTKDNAKLSCKIIGLNGKVLDKDGPSEYVSCSYSTF